MDVRRARAAALPHPRRRGSLALGLPSGRSLLLGLALVGMAVGAFALARQTSIFAIRTIEVRGAPPAIRARVTRALRVERGVSLLRIDGGVVDRALAAVPEVASSTVDRAFPSTLVVTVRTERPVAVLRRGAESWLVSARGRVLQKLRHGARPALPRVWVDRKADVARGVTLADDDGGRAVHALAPLAPVRFPARVVSAAAGEDRLVLKLASGLELRLGSTERERLKLAVARRILPGLGPVTPGDYLDVSVPERPVAYLEAQVEG